MLARGQPGVDERVNGGRALRFQAGDLGGDHRGIGQVRQWRVCPQCQRLGQGRGCGCRVAQIQLSLALRDQVVELVDIELAGPHRHQVAALLAMSWRPAARRSDAVQPTRAITQALPQPADAHAQRCFR